MIGDAAVALLNTPEHGRDNLRRARRDRLVREVERLDRGSAEDIAEAHEVAVRAAFAAGIAHERDRARREALAERLDAVREVGL